MTTDVHNIAVQLFLLHHVRTSDDAISCSPCWLATRIASPAYSSSVICPCNTYTHSHTHNSSSSAPLSSKEKAAFHEEMSAFTLHFFKNLCESRIWQTISLLIRLQSHCQLSDWHTHTYTHTSGGALTVEPFWCHNIFRVSERCDWLPCFGWPLGQTDWCYKYGSCVLIYLVEEWGL